MCVCVCVCQRERERESFASRKIHTHKGPASMISNLNGVYFLYHKPWRSQTAIHSQNMPTPLPKKSPPPPPPPKKKSSNIMHHWEYMWIVCTVRNFTFTHSPVYNYKPLLIACTHQQNQTCTRVADTGCLEPAQDKGDTILHNVSVVTRELAVGVLTLPSQQD